MKGGWGGARKEKRKKKKVKKGMPMLTLALQMPRGTILVYCLATIYSTSPCCGPYFTRIDARYARQARDFFLLTLAAINTGYLTLVGTPALLHPLFGTVSGDVRPEKKAVSGPGSGPSQASLAQSGHHGSKPQRLATKCDAVQTERRYQIDPKSASETLDGCRVAVAAGMGRGVLCRRSVGTYHGSRLVVRGSRSRSKLPTSAPVARQASDSRSA